MAFAQLKDVTLHYELEGSQSAQVLVLSHSLGVALGIWAQQVAALSGKLRLLRYDTRGHGSSSVPDGDYAMEDLGGDVLGLLDALGIGKAHFCGVSLGGMTGLWLGVHASHRLHSLIVADTAALIGTREGWDARIAQVRAEGMASVAEGTLERWYTAAFREKHPEQVAATRRMLLATSVAGYTGCCAAVRDEDLTEAVGSVDVPTLVMSGKHDPVTPVKDGLFLQREIAGARFLELDGAHLAHVEDAVGFERNTLEFVAKSIDSAG
jgi:3-oxoadipate enol-lactonase